MKEFLLYIFLAFKTSIAFSQNSIENLSFFQNDWSPAKTMESATYFMDKVRENDTTYVCRYYQKIGPLVKWETYKDSSLSIPHGIWAWYNTNGDIDSTGEFSDGKRDKYWRYGIVENSGIYASAEYNKGRVIKQTNFLTRKVISNGTESDLNESTISISLPINGGTGALIDDRPAEFQNGGYSGWTQYLAHNLKIPNKFSSVAGSHASASVLTEFEINEIGQVINALTIHSREWSADLAALSIIKNSPPWNPARKGGKFVVSNKIRQKLTFRVNI